MKNIIFFLSLWVISSCSFPYGSQNIYGADEFVLDSYKIREGKFSILEMEGQIENISYDLEEVSPLGTDKHVYLAGLADLSKIEVDSKSTLFDVLSLAKIGPKANLFKSYILRGGNFLAVDFYKLLKEGDMTQNIVLQGGDKIYIAPEEDASLMVMGEVGQQKRISLPKGYLSLREALAAAGGIPFTGDKSYIQVVRGSIVNPKIYILNWKHIIQLPNNSLLLMPGDLVYVAAKPISEWGRFISQLIPLFNVTIQNSCVKE